MNWQIEMKFYVHKKRRNIGIIWKIWFFYCLIGVPFGTCPLFNIILFSIKMPSLPTIQDNSFYKTKVIVFGISNYVNKVLCMNESFRQKVLGSRYWVAIFLVLNCLMLKGTFSGCLSFVISSMVRNVFSLLFRLMASLY